MSASRTLKVLVVEDNDDAREMLADLLEVRGYETRTARDAYTALALAKDFLPAIAVLDIGLPVVNGYELAVQLRRCVGLERVRIVALTGYGQETDRLRSRDAGIDVHLVKPIDVASLTAAFEAAPALD